MMRSVFLLIALSGSAASAQNWALLNPAYKYNYSNDGTDTISNQIFVTHIDTLGVDSFRYELNPGGVICPACSQGHTAACWSGLETDLVRITAPQALGQELILDGTAWYFVGESDTLLVETMAASGSSWVGPGNISAVIYAETETELFGSADSLKWAAFSNGDTLVLSRDHGIVHANRASAGHFELIGRDGPLVEGNHFPRVIDLFNYQVGDVLQYHDESTFQSSFCVHFVDGRTKYEVLTRTDGEGTTTYTLERTFTAHEESYYPQMWTPCGTYNYEGQEQISFVVEHDSFTEVNFFGSGLRGPLFPGAMDSVFLEPVSNGSPTMLASRLDSLGRYVVEPNIIYTSGWEASLLCRSNEDSLLFFPSDDHYRFTMVEGVGLTYLDWFRFESGATRTLEGYLLNGQQWGSIWSNSVILGDNENSVEATALFPNPASDLVRIGNTRPGAWCTITDMRGRAVLRHTATDMNELLDVRILPPSVYVLTTDGSTPQRLIIQR